MKEKGKKLLRTALNDQNADFRAGQWECIDALLRKRRMLVVQRTGWGKSMVYFLATRMLRDAGEGITLLISPLHWGWGLTSQIWVLLFIFSGLALWYTIINRWDVLGARWTRPMAFC